MFGSSDLLEHMGYPRPTGEKLRRLLSKLE
jgi:hypothetical protein